MTHAAVATTPPTVPPGVPIAVLGTDALLAALPATPVQLARACLRAGFVNVIPASWGDELLAAAALQRLRSFGSGPVIHCSCPIVAHRLLSEGGDLRPVMLPLVAPPVAVARYIRSLSRPTHVRITYIGACPGANDEAIDIRMTPEALLGMLAEREIVLDQQPRDVDTIVPPDRRRFRSQPGGLPSAEALWKEPGSRSLIEIDGEDLVGDLAQHLLSGKNVLLDASVRLGCVCSGAIAGGRAADARARIVADEPPRSTTPVIDERVSIELDAPIPAVSCTPVDIAALPLHQGGAPTPEGARPRSSGPVAARSLTGIGAAPRPPREAVRALPRTYVARRRSPTEGIPVLPSRPSTARSAAPVIAPAIAIAPPAPAPARYQSMGSIATAADTTPGLPRSAPSAVFGEQTPAMTLHRDPRDWTIAPAVVAWAPSRRAIIGFVVTLALVIVASVVIGAWVSREMIPGPPASVAR